MNNYKDWHLILGVTVFFIILTPFYFYLTERTYIATLVTVAFMGFYGFLGSFVKRRIALEKDEFRKELENYQPQSSDYDKWPSKKFEKAIGQYNRCVTNYPRDTTIQDVSHIASRQLLDNLPEVKMYGSDLWLDHRATYGGVFARALEKQDANGFRERCLEYLFVNTSQVRLIGLIMWLLMPILICVYILMFGSAYIIISWLPLLIYGVLHLIKHRKGGIFILNSLMPIGLWLVALCISLTDYSLHFWILPGIVIFTILLVFILEIALPAIGIHIGSHPMDYTPVLIWLKDIGASHWQLEDACWDETHYHTSLHSRTKIDEHIGRGKGNQSRIRLIMEDTWHSLRLGSRKDVHWLVTHLAQLLFFLFPFFSQAIYYFFENETVIVRDSYFVLCVFIFVGLGLIVLRGPYDVTGYGYQGIRRAPLNHDPTLAHMARSVWPFVDMAHLTDDTLEEMCRLRDSRGKKTPSLKIGTILQDPFSFRDRLRDTSSFRDGQTKFTDDPDTS